MKVRGAILALIAGLGLAIGIQSAVRAEGDGLSFGRRVYVTHCAVCHGEKGDGQGSDAWKFSAPPRDFTKAEYKLRSTESGQLPMDADLIRSVAQGLPGTSMVPQDHLSEREIMAVVRYIKAFSSEFSEEPPPQPLEIPPEPSRTPETLTRGRKAYLKGECDTCHGPEGMGDGPSAKDLSVKPADLTRRPLKSGPTPRDIFRTVYTGMDGTPMPSYFLVLDDDEIWDMAHYIHSLGRSSVVTEDERKGWEVEGRKPPQKQP